MEVLIPVPVSMASPGNTLCRWSSWGHQTALLRYGCWACKWGELGHRGRHALGADAVRELELCSHKPGNVCDCEQTTRSQQRSTDRILSITSEEASSAFISDSWLYFRTVRQFCCSVAQSCLILCRPRDAKLLCPWYFQARILEWVAISFSRGSSRPRDETCLLH